VRGGQEQVIAVDKDEKQSLGDADGGEMHGEIPWLGSGRLAVASF
jgi:hypothetical protein